MLLGRISIAVCIQADNRSRASPNQLQLESKANELTARRSSSRPGHVATTPSRPRAEGPLGKDGLRN